jgi:outer membrane protein OmpA-like peptidoglycan-associated protein
MNRPRPFTILFSALATFTAVGCGQKRVAPSLRPGEAQVVLLPDPGAETVGHATVTNPAGTAELDVARASVTASPGQPPAVTILSESDVTRLFGDLLSTLPPPPEQFLLYFRFESDELTAQSRALFPRILEALKKRPFPDLTVVGHTDTTGSAASNIELGLKRADAVRSLLVAAGVSANVIEVTSHGEADLLIKTADEVLEPRNRRVEITIR